MSQRRTRLQAHACTILTLLVVGIAAGGLIGIMMTIAAIVIAWPHAAAAAGAVLVYGLVYSVWRQLQL